MGTISTDLALRAHDPLLAFAEYGSITWERVTRRPGRGLWIMRCFQLHGLRHDIEARVCYLLDSLPTY